jgi:hypothetical protein
VRKAQNQFYEYWIGWHDAQYRAPDSAASSAGADVSNGQLEVLRQKAGLPLASALDYLCFLFNKGFIHDERIAKYWHSEFSFIFDNVLKAHLNEYLVSDQHLIEVKELHRNLIGSKDR